MSEYKTYKRERASTDRIYPSACASGIILGPVKVHDLRVWLNQPLSNKNTDDIFIETIDQYPLVRLYE